MLFYLPAMIALRCLLVGIVLHFSCGVVHADALTMRELTFLYMHANDSFCPPYEQIVQLMEGISAATFGRVTLVDEQPSAEGRRIIMAVVKPYLVRHPRHPRARADRQSYWMDAGMEGNDCHVVTSLLAVVGRLAFDCRENCDGDYYIIPLVNPDGYEYARKFDSKWIKNRQPFAVGRNPMRTASTNGSIVAGNNTKTCYGIRLDFNYPAGTTFYLGGSSDPCSEIHRGPGPAHAPEVQAVMKLKLAVPKLRFAITFMSLYDHNYDIEGPQDLLLHPNAYTPNVIHESKQYYRLGYANNKAVRDSDNYRVYSSPYAYYWPHGGSSLDYWYFTQPSCYSYIWTLQRHENASQTINVRVNRVMAGINGMINRMDSGPL